MEQDLKNLLGKKGIDTVTGYSGIVTAICINVKEETRVKVESVDTTGRPIDWWFSIDRLEFVD